jgi:uncharacterized protein (DUF2147 family)
MKKVILLTVILFSSFSAILAQDDKIIKGIWLNSDKDAKVEIYSVGNQYSGKIIWAKNMFLADGTTPAKDIRNPDGNLQGRTIANMVIIDGFTYKDGEWGGGKIYDPKTGKTYNGKMKISGGKLEVRAYVGSPMFGKTIVWTRQ